MKIEFYHKVTGDIYDDPKQFIIDHEGNVYYDYGDCYAPHIGWRIIDQWQPIETAPKDGTWIQLFYKDRNRPYVGKWFAPQCCVSHWCIEGNATIGVDPSYWMPLPPNPQSSESNPQS